MNVKNNTEPLDEEVISDDELAKVIDKAHSEPEYISAFMRVSKKLVDMSVDVNSFAEYVAFVNAIRIACDTNEKYLKKIAKATAKSQEKSETKTTKNEKEPKPKRIAIPFEGKDLGCTYNTDKLNNL